ncbi:3-oxoacyl-[acyl-carrier-protein] synthase III C-terminal domain-containing protein, partial [Pseudomonas protegens]|uniref:3-oxoacyl-[acyl-carrier-protein] synthase III C-terminal domain-containing protein n=1 Tax=Pseudomonas protegens TaxID=380021 RepID=UPI0024A70ABC
QVLLEHHIVIVGGAGVQLGHQAFGGAPGDLTESYAGAGAAALLIGSQDVIAEFDASFSCAAEGLMAKLHTSPADYDYVVFQQNLVSTPYSLAKHLGFNPKQVEPGIYAGNVGDAGSASPLLGLINVLDQARPGQKILLVSYGFGAGSDAIALTVTDAIEQYQKHNKPLRELLESKIYVDYGTSIKYEFKYLRADYALTAYL